MTEFVKIDTAVLDYEEDWTAWLEGDTISTSSWVADTGITIDSDSNTTVKGVVWLSGGTVGESYDVTNTITTAGLRTDSRTIEITITDQKFD